MASQGGSISLSAAQLNAWPGPRRARCWSFAKRNTISSKESKMKTETEIDPAKEPMRTRVALHPFLAGMNRTQLAFLQTARCRFVSKLRKQFSGKAKWPTGFI